MVLEFDEKTAELLGTLKECPTCGAQNEDVKYNSVALFVPIHAMGQIWKHHLVCKICGSAHEAKTEKECVSKWNDRAMPLYTYPVESMKEANV